MRGVRAVGDRRGPRRGGRGGALARDGPVVGGGRVRRRARAVPPYCSTTRGRGGRARRPRRRSLRRASLGRKGLAARRKKTPEASSREGDRGAAHAAVRRALLSSRGCARPRSWASTRTSRTWPRSREAAANAAEEDEEAGRRRRQRRRRATPPPPTKTAARRRAARAATSENAAIRDVLADALEPGRSAAARNSTVRGNPRRTRARTRALTRGRVGRVLPDVGGGSSPRFSPRGTIVSPSKDPPGPDRLPFLRLPRRRRLLLALARTWAFRRALCTAGRCACGTCTRLAPGSGAARGRRRTFARRAARAPARSSTPSRGRFPSSLRPMRRRRRGSGATC